ncbi:MAG: methyltransferase domain-containing protein [Anaerolineae bacterium]|nr:methyltransferase domain-containing protein [Anaerolineae bacterium]
MAEAASKPVGTREWYDFVGQLADTIPGIHIGGQDATHTLLEMCQIDETRPILDVGCGAGHTACLIAQKFGAQVHGIDISEVMISKAQERANRMGLTDRVKFRTADAYQLPFEDGCFDVVLIESVLTPLPGDKVQALREMMRVLRPGGLIGANESIVAPEVPPEILAAFARHPATYGHFTASTLRESFARAGLQEIQMVEAMNVEAPNPLKMMGLCGFLSFMIRTYPKIILTLLRDARFREAARIDDQITKGGKQYMGYALIVGRKPKSHA